MRVLGPVAEDNRQGWFTSQIHEIISTTFTLIPAPDVGCETAVEQTL